MRIYFILLGVFLALSSLACADEADPFLAVEKAKPVRERWQDCTAAEVKQNLHSTRAAEEIVDQAFASCKAREAALGAVLRGQVGAASARRIVADLRSYDRAVLIRIVERLRGK